MRYCVLKSLASSIDTPIFDATEQSEIKTSQHGIYKHKNGNVIRVEKIESDYVYFLSAKKGDEIQIMLVSEFRANVLPIYDFETAQIENLDLPF